MIDMQEFLKNQQQFPPDELAKYRGKYIAFSPDGTKIVASADDYVALEEAVKASGYPVEDCCISGVPAYDTQLGGFSPIR